MAPNRFRRSVLAALALVPLVSRAQVAARRRRVAFVGFPAMFDGPDGLDAVIRALRERGFADGREIEVVRIPIVTKPDEEAGRGFAYLVPKLEREVLPRMPDVVVVLGSIMAGGMQRATRTIPIVASVADPVGAGLAASIARPGGNVTGLSAGFAETSVKTFDFMKRLVPGLARVAIFHDSRTMAARHAATYERAAREAGLEPLMTAATDTDTLVRALRALPPGRVQAGLMAWSPSDGQVDFYREAVAMRLPLVGAGEEDAEKGALVSYQAHDPAPLPQRLAAVAEQVLRGGDPAAIPFRYPQGFRLVVNRRTAKSLGFTVPPDLLLRADRVIE